MFSCVYTHTHTYIYIYIYICLFPFVCVWFYLTGLNLSIKFIYMCVCVCVSVVRVCVWKGLIMIFLLHQEHFFCRWVVVFSLYELCFRLILAKPWFVHLKHYFPKTCFSAYITHSSVNFAWFAFLSHQQFIDRPLFCLGAIPWFVSILNWTKLNIKEIFVINQFQIMLSLHLWKNIF